MCNGLQIGSGTTRRTASARGRIGPTVLLTKVACLCGGTLVADEEPAHPERKNLYHWSLGLMTEFDWVRHAAHTRYDTVFINTITVGHPIVGPLAGYVEFYSEVSEASEWIGTVDLGLTYRLTQNLQLDGGVNLGVTRSAENVTPFLGLTARF